MIRTTNIDTFLSNEEDVSMSSSVGVVSPDTMKVKEEVAVEEDEEEDDPEWADVTLEDNSNTFMKNTLEKVPSLEKTQLNNNPS